MTTSAVLGIPYISSQQNSPEITHNEAIQMLQIIAGTGVISIGDNSPPLTPSEGDAYIVGDSPTGDWADRANCITAYLEGQWVFVPGVDSNGTIIEMGADQEGLRVWHKNQDAFYAWSNFGESPDIYSWQEIVIQSIAAEDYGQLTISNNTTTTAATAAVDPTLKTNSDYAQLTSVWDAIPHGENNGVTQGTNSLTIAADGVYYISIWANVSTDTNSTKLAFKFAVNGAIGLSRRPAIRMTTSGIFYNLSGFGFVQLNAGDVVTLYYASDKTANITFEDVVFGIHEMRRL